MPSFKIIGLLVLEKKIFKGFYHIWAWWPSWSCDLDHLYKLSFPLPKEAPHKIWLWLAKRFQRRRCLNIVDDDKTTTDARVRVYYKLTLWALRLRWAKKSEYKVSHLMRLWYLSRRRPAKAQAISQEPSLFARMKYGSRQRVRPKIRHLAPLDGCSCLFEEWVYGGRKVP